MRRVTALASLMTCAALAGCGAVGYVGEGEVRHDLEPIVTRVPKAEILDTVSWISGPILENERALQPGPPAYRLQVVGTVSSEEMDELEDAFALEVYNGDVDLWPDLEPLVSDGPWFRSGVLDHDWNQDADDEWRVEVYISPGDEQVVLKMTQ